MGAIELVSPSNKDRPESRDAFVSKCIAIVNRGAGLLIVDIVTSRRANLFDAILERMNVPVEKPVDLLYAAAFHVSEGTKSQSQVRIWQEHLGLEQILPTLPLYLRVGPMMPVDLQSTYLETCRQLRIPAPDVVAP
jgi:hypothetical protein